MAKSLETNYRWEEAGKRYEYSIIIDPFNAEHFAGFGKFLLQKAGYSQGLNRINLLVRAIDLYKKAIILDAATSEYYFNLGTCQIGLFLENKDKYMSKLAEGLSNFKKAITNDTNGFNASYSFGYLAMSVWDYLADEDKALALDKLKYSLSIYPEYHIYVYPKLWLATKNFDYLQRATPDNLEAQRHLYDFIKNSNLWHFRKRQADVVALYEQKESPDKFKTEKEKALNEIKALKSSVVENKIFTGVADAILVKELTGKTAEGKNDIINGKLYANGTIHVPILMRSGKVKISIKAKKVLMIKTQYPASPKFYPYMIVRLDTEEIGELFVPNDDWKEYDFSAETNGGLKILSVTFINDVYNPKKFQDRNLEIGDIRITYE